MVRGEVEYSSNNSGGSWWLNDEDWFALEAAGWEIDWFKDRERNIRDYPADRFLGALASNAVKKDTTLREAIDEWESVTLESASALGCSCCGTPHSFLFRSPDGGYEYYSPDYP